jgi:hypothetical protein
MSKQFSIFGVLKQVFGEAATKDAFKVWASFYAVVGDRLRATYNMPYARVSILGMHAASGGVPPNPLETGRI